MRLIIALALVLALSACNRGQWSKQGVSSDRAAQDLSECNHMAELANKRDSNIDTDILSSRGADWDRLGVLQMKRNTYADSNAARSGDSIINQCMTGKGYSTSTGS